MWTVIDVPEGGECGLQESRVADGEGALDLVGLEAQGRRADDAGQGGHVVELADHAAKTDPVGHVAAVQVDDLEPAVGVRSPGGEGLVEGQAAEGLVATGPGEADDGVVAG